MLVHEWHDVAHSDWPYGPILTTRVEQRNAIHVASVNSKKYDSGLKFPLAVKEQVMVTSGDENAHTG